MLVSHGMLIRKSAIEHEIISESTASLVNRLYSWSRMAIAKWLNGFFLAIACVFSIANGGHHTIGNLEVDSSEDGVPSLDTGMYLMSQEFPFDAYIKTVNACAFLTEPNSNPQGTGGITIIFLAAGYRLMDNNFRKITATLHFFIIINDGETLGCNTINFPSALQSKVLKGDRPGVLVSQEECIQSVLNPPWYSCPAHVNIVDPSKNCSQSLYFNSTGLEDGDIPAELNAIDGQPVDVFINLDIDVEPDPSQNDNLESSERKMICASKFNGTATRTSQTPVNLAVVLPIIAVGVALTSVLIILGVVLFLYRRRRKEKLKLNEESDHTNIIEYNSTDIQPQCKSHYHPANHSLSNSQMAVSFRRTPSNSNEYSVSIASSRRVCVTVTNEMQNSEEDMEHYENNGDIEGELDAEYEYADVEDYWEPANQERRLKEQIGSLNIKEISIKNLEIKEQLGRGQFATVHCGKWWDPGESDSFKDVAVKRLKEGASEEQRICFLREAAIMGQFEHPNILQILAIAYSEDMEPVLIVDLMHIGDLHQHLLSLRPKNYSQVSQELSPTLLSYSRQIAFGMLYLSCKKFVHRDLAARNVLVANDGTCKIADFGLSRDLQYQDYYISQGGKVPVKWTAPEALHYRKYSTASDVWSYGCLLYEIWSLGCKPFSKCNNTEAMKQVASGYRLPPPPGCPRTIYSIMIKCWNPKPELRTPIMKIVVALQQPDFKILRWSPRDAQCIKSENAKYLGAPLAEGKCLYKSLQCTYTRKTDREDKTDSRIIQTDSRIIQTECKHRETSRKTLASSTRVSVANYYNLDTPLLAPSKLNSTL